MFRTKQEMDRHVNEILKYLEGDSERKLKCYQIARYYFKVGESYLGIGAKMRALDAFKVSIELDRFQPDLLFKVCKLLCDPEIPVVAGCVTYWLERAEPFSSKDPVVLKLKERLLKCKENNRQLEKLILLNKNGDAAGTLSPGAVGDKLDHIFNVYNVNTFLSTANQSSHSGMRNVFDPRHHTSRMEARPIPERFDAQLPHLSQEYSTGYQSLLEGVNSTLKELELLAQDSFEEFEISSQKLPDFRSAGIQKGAPFSKNALGDATKIPVAGVSPTAASKPQSPNVVITSSDTLPAYTNSGGLTRIVTLPPQGVSPQTGGPKSNQTHAFQIPMPTQSQMVKDEQELKLFKSRAELFILCKNEGERREYKGFTGEIRVLHNERLGKARIVMMRDQDFKLIADHYVTPEMELRPLNSNERIWLWGANDVFEGVKALPNYGIRFKTIDELKYFKCVFNKAKEIARDSKCCGKQALITTGKEENIFDMTEFNFISGSSLKKIAAISVVQALWKSSDIINKINEFITGRKSKSLQRNNYWRQFKPRAYIDDRDNYCRWEKIIDVVREKVNLLPLPAKLITHLRKLVILMGEKIYYFYNEYQVGEDGVVSWKCHRCRKCAATAGTEHHYSFSNRGIMSTNCPSLHLKKISLQGNEKFQDTDRSKQLRSLFRDAEKLTLLKDACRSCDIEIIEKHQEEIITYLESLNPGLNLKCKKDVVFSIVCVWYLMDSKLKWERKYSRVIDSSGYLQLPQNCFYGSPSENTKIDVPIEIVPQMCLNSYPSAFKYFATKLRSLNDQSFFSNMVKLVMGYELPDKISSRLHFHPTPDFTPEKMLFILNLIAPDKKSEFIEENLNDLMMCFLSVWPFQELVPQLLDSCVLKNNSKLDYQFLSLLIIDCIEMENESRYQLRKQFYMDIFEKVWLNTPKEIKRWIFAKKTRFLLKHDPNAQVLKIALTTNDPDDELKMAYTFWDKYCQVLESNNFEFEFIKTFMGGLVHSGDFEEFVYLYLGDKHEQKDILFANNFIA